MLMLSANNKRVKFPAARPPVKVVELSEELRDRCLRNQSWPDSKYDDNTRITIRPAYKQDTKADVKKPIMEETKDDTIEVSDVDVNSKIDVPKEANPDKATKTKSYLQQLHLRQKKMKSLFLMIIMILMN